MEIKSGEKYIHDINSEQRLFQIPNTAMKETYLIEEINYLDGPSPVGLCWAGKNCQPALYRKNGDDFYLAFSMCVRNSQNEGYATSWENFPPSLTANVFNSPLCFCNDGGKYDFFYFTTTYASVTPIYPNIGYDILRNNKSMSILRCTIWDKDYKYGAHLTLQASLEGNAPDQGSGRIVMFYSHRAIPLLNGQ